MMLKMLPKREARSFIPFEKQIYTTLLCCKAPFFSFEDTAYRFLIHLQTSQMHQMDLLDIGDVQ